MKIILHSPFTILNYELSIEEVTATEAIDHVFSIVWKSPLRGAVSGSVHRYARPPGSRLEEVTVNILGEADARQLQSAVLNVNIHVPNPPAAAIVEGRPATVRDTPDEQRVAVLASLAAGALAPRYDAAARAYTELEGQSVLPDGEWTLVNNRVRIRAKNL